MAESFQGRGYAASSVEGWTVLSADKLEVENCR